MPRIEDNAVGFTTSPSITPTVESESPSIGETFEAGFALENDVVNFVDLMSRPQFKADPLFAPRLGSELRKYDEENRTRFFEDYRDNFIGVQSREEMLWMMQRINTEQKHRDTLSRGGFMGFAAMTLAGALSPTSFIPLVGPATKAKTALQFAREAALLGAGVGVAQEGVLMAAQEDRGWDEVAIGIASSTVLSGLLGGAVGVLTRAEREAVERSLNDSHLIITDLNPSAAGATGALAESPGQLASGGVAVSRAIDSTRLARNPVSYNVRQPMRMVKGRLEPVPYLQSNVARGAMIQLSDGGFRLEGNARGIATAPGGTIENNIQTYYNVFPEVVRHLDDGFLEYRFDGKAPAVKPQWQATLGDVFNQTNGKLSKSEYKAEITKALRNNDEHEIPQVAATAKFIRERLLNPILREAQAAGVIPKEIDLKGDVSWILRDYNRKAISRNTTKFINQLADHFERKMQDEFAQQLVNLKKGRERTEELVQDLQRPADEVRTLQEEFLEQLRRAEDVEEFDDVEDQIAALRAEARELRSSQALADVTRRKELLKQARELQAKAGPEFEALRQTRADLRRRLRNLTRSAASLSERQAKKLERVDRIEELSLNALRRVARAGQKFLSQMDRWSDERLDAEVSKLKDQFAKLAEQYDRGEERLTKMAEDGDLRGVQLEEYQQVRAEKMTDVAERLEGAEDLDRAAIRQQIEDTLTEALERVNAVNAKRAQRSQRLMAQAEALDPAQVTRRIEEVRGRQSERELSFMDRWRTLGADDIDIDAGTAVFRQRALEVATEAKNNIMGAFIRLPTVDQLRGPRGSEIARTLDIPSNLIEEFLENDVEKLIRSTLRTLPPDIEIARRPEFGDVNGEQMFVRLQEEMDQRLAEVDASNVSEKTKVKRREEIHQTFGLYKKNLEAVIGRLRHTWGLPDDPEAMGYRLGRLMLNFNVLRLMGGVAISSLPDVGRPVMRYGFGRVMRDAVIPLITDFKRMKMTMAQVRALAGGLDVTMQSRAAAIFDMLDDVGRGSKFERGVEYATNRMGLVALFDYWTVAMKQFSGAVAHAKFMDSIDALMNGGKRIDTEEATRYLAENGIDGEMAQRIWAEMQKPGGANFVDGRWWPNVENWTDTRAQRAYSSAIVREVNTSIITPGVDKPLWVDKNMMGRLLAQFKSFAFASTSRTLIAGLQQRDAAVVQGVFSSLLFGMLGYWVYAQLAGGRIKAEMENADADKWIDEAIARSGLLGIFAEVQRIAERIPATQPYATFSGTRSARRGGDNLTEALLGPSFDALSTAASVITSIDSPTDGTVHQFRTLTPGQNIFWLRRMFDAMEEAAPVSERSP